MRSQASVSLAARIVGAFLLAAAMLMTSLAFAEPRQTETSNNDEPNNGPVRLARFSYVAGNVSWRPDDQAEWSQAVWKPLMDGGRCPRHAAKSLERRRRRVFRNSHVRWIHRNGAAKRTFRLSDRYHLRLCRRRRTLSISDQRETGSTGVRQAGACHRSGRPW